MEMSKKEFGQAVFEGICQMQEAVLANTEDNTDCSARHKRIMKIIADKRVSPSMAARLLSKKKVLLAFIAAATIVLSCTAYAFRNEIRAIVERIFDDHVSVEFNGENVAEKIEKEYTVNYLLERQTVLTSEVAELGRYLTNSVIEAVRRTVNRL